MYALQNADYEPTISALAQMASDNRPIPRLRIGPVGQGAVDLFALFQLANRAESSEVARGAFAQGVEHASDYAIQGIRRVLRERGTDTARRLLELLPDRPTEAPPGKSRSKGS